MKSHILNAFKVILFCSLMFLLGSSLFEGYERDVMGFSFLCASLALILAWCEIKKTLLMLKK